MVDRTQSIVHAMDCDKLNDSSVLVHDASPHKALSAPSIGSSTPSSSPLNAGDSSAQMQVDSVSLPNSSMLSGSPVELKSNEDVLRALFDALKSAPMSLIKLNEYKKVLTNIRPGGKYPVTPKERERVINKKPPSTDQMSRYKKKKQSEAERVAEMVKIQVAAVLKAHGIVAVDAVKQSSNDVAHSNSYSSTPTKSTSEEESPVNTCIKSSPIKSTPGEETSVKRMLDSAEFSHHKTENPGDTATLKFQSGEKIVSPVGWKSQITGRYILHWLALY